MGNVLFWHLIAIYERNGIYCHCSPIYSKDCERKGFGG